MNGEATRNRRGRQQKEKRRERQGNLCSLWLRDWDIRHPAETEGITSSPAGPLLVTQTTKISHHSKGLGCSPCFMPQAKQQRYLPYPWSRARPGAKNLRVPDLPQVGWGDQDHPWLLSTPEGCLGTPHMTLVGLEQGSQQYLKTKQTSMTWQRLKNETLMGIKVQRIK